MATIEVLRYAHFTDLIFWAGKIERNEAIAVQTLSRLEGRVEYLIRKKECRSPFLKAAVSVQLALLDGTSERYEYELWSERLMTAHNLLQHALSCLPTEGNIWARAGMVEAAISENPFPISNYIRISQLYGPFEERQVIARYFFYNRLTSATINLLEDAIQKDFKVLCSEDLKYRRRSLPAPGLGLTTMLSKFEPQCSIGRES